MPRRVPCEPSGVLRLNTASVTVIDPITSFAVGSGDRVRIGDLDLADRELGVVGVLGVVLAAQRHVPDEVGRRDLLPVEDEPPMDQTPAPPPEPAPAPTAESIEKVMRSPARIGPRACGG